MRRDRRTREQRKADASARIAAFCLFLAALLILFAVLTVKTTGQPYKGEPPVVEDKLPGEDKPAEGSAVAERRTASPRPVRWPPRAARSRLTLA